MERLYLPRPTTPERKAVIAAYLGTTLSRGDVCAHPQ